MITYYPNYKDRLAKIHAQNQATDQQDKVAILQDMRQHIVKEGDKALNSYTAKFDGATIDQLLVSDAEFEAAHTQVSQAFIDAIRYAVSNIKTYHQKQLPQSWYNQGPDVLYGMQYRPLEKVGLYVPGGRAPYPSTVMMDVIPALIAGVGHIVLATPPRQDGSIAPQILAAADLCGVRSVYKMGGAQAVFAMAHGTESVPKVDKIVGPGNIFVTLAKQMVYGQVDIDKPAGPSEALVYVESDTYVSMAAAEMLAQLEHDPDASAVGIVPSEAYANALQVEMQTQVEGCSRKDIILEAAKNAAIFVAPNRALALEMINAVASEHTVLLVDDYDDLLKQVDHAGAIFCGPYSPVALGDYVGGPNHVLPTSGAARFASPLSVMDFMKFSSVIGFSKAKLAEAAPHIEAISAMEGFDAHDKSVKQRFTP